MMRTGTWALLFVVLTAPRGAAAYVGYDDEGDPMYGWSDTDNPSDADSPEYDFSSISGSGTSINFYMGDVQGPFDIGFDFEYFGETYDSVYVSSYGLVGFASLSSTWSIAETPSAGAPNNIIAAAWTSGYSSYDSTGYYETTGSGGVQRFIVELSLLEWDWYTWVNIQVILEEGSNDIYVQVESSSTWYTTSIGIENDDGTRGISSYYASPSASPLSEYAAYFSPALERPSIRVVTRELVVEEGGSIDLEIDVNDRQGDHETTVWDIDGDGEFDDGEGDTVTISAANADGPSELTPRVRATDRAGNVTERVIAIEVKNMPPVFTGVPVTEVLRRTEWTYAPAIVDPGNDVVTVTAVERPAGMTVLAGGSLRWTPTDEDIGPHAVRLLARDDDDDEDEEGDGDATLEFTLEVVDNTPPGPPLIIRPEQGDVLDTLRPTFEVQTPTDPEGDTLFITFDVDTADTFSSSNLVTSGRIPAALGSTGWRPTEELLDGQRYWWRVYADDGIDQGPASRGRFSIDTAGDAGPDGGVDAGDAGTEPTVEGCNCRATTARSAGAPLTLAVVVWLVLGAMRRSRSTAPER